MLGITQSAALVGVDAHPVQVEVNTGEAGELKFILVGLPDAAVKESQDRVFSAMANSGIRRVATSLCHSSYPKYSACGLP